MFQEAFPTRIILHTINNRYQTFISKQILVQDNRVKLCEGQNCAEVLNPKWSYLVK